MSLFFFLHNTLEEEVLIPTSVTMFWFVQLFVVGGGGGKTGNITLIMPISTRKDMIGLMYMYRQG